MSRNRVVAGLVFVGVIVGAAALSPKLWRSWEESHRLELPPVRSPEEGAAYLNVLPDVVELNQIKTVEAKKPTVPRRLQLRGMLALDPNRLIHVHARFPGQIYELATVPAAAAPAIGTTVIKRPIAFMDPVKKDQRLAVVWSKDLGEKKSELVDALTRLRLDEVNLRQVRTLAEKGSVSIREVREAERQVEVGKIAVEKARRTLRSWFVEEDEIKKVEEESEAIHRAGRSAGGQSDLERDPAWASAEIYSPIDGTIVEKNVAKGDIVDTDDDLFKVADLTTLIAWAHAYEEDLPYLYEIQKASGAIHWRITLNSNPNMTPIEGVMDRISDIFDPMEHMAPVAGPVPNPNLELMAGQFITATVDLPLERGVVIVPTRALVEDGEESVVLVEDPSQPHRFTKRRVSVVRRYRDEVYLRSDLTGLDELRKKDVEELHEGELVVASGALELKEALSQKQSRAREKAKP